MMKKLFFILAITCLICSCSTNQPGVVKVTGGLIQGTFEDDLMVFRGIPFAAPPVGDLRWKAPQPVEKWEGIRQATAFAPAPMQGGNPPSGKSEDCLYLNVWTPAKKLNEKIPVMVYIYGGDSAEVPLPNHGPVAKS
jgi:para-nitrobenzyl esterase